MRDDRDQLIRRRSQQFGLSYGTIWRVLREDLGLKAYKIQLVQEWKLPDFSLRHVFCECAFKQLNNDFLFYREILFSDEAHFWLIGYVNKKN